jgi:hypothetical protein
LWASESAAALPALNPSASFVDLLISGNFKAAFELRVSPKEELERYRNDVRERCLSDAHRVQLMLPLACLRIVERFMHSTFYKTVDPNMQARSVFLAASGVAAVWHEWQAVGIQYHEASHWVDSDGEMCDHHRMCRVIDWMRHLLLSHVYGVAVACAGMPDLDAMQSRAKAALCDQLTHVLQLVVPLDVSNALGTRLSYAQRLWTGTERHMDNQTCEDRCQLVDLMAPQTEVERDNWCRQRKTRNHNFGRLLRLGQFDQRLFKQLLLTDDLAAVRMADATWRVAHLDQYRQWTLLEPSQR